MGRDSDGRCEEVRGGDVYPETLLSRLETGEDSVGYRIAMEAIRNSEVLCNLRIVMEEAGFAVEGIAYNADREGRVRVLIDGRKRG